MAAAPDRGMVVRAAPGWAAVALSALGDPVADCQRGRCPCLPAPLHPARLQTEIQITLTSAAVAEAETADPSRPHSPRALLVSAGQLPGRVAERAAEIPERLAQLALASHARCSKWARLAGIPALAGCALGRADGGQEGGDAADLGCHSPAGGGAQATPAGHDAASVYEATAAASLATSLLATRRAGGAAAGAAAPLLTVMCVRHGITSDIPEHPAVAEIVEVGWGQRVMRIGTGCHPGVDLRSGARCPRSGDCGARPVTQSTPRHAPPLGRGTAAVRQGHGGAHGCGSGILRSGPGRPVCHVSRRCCACCACWPGDPAWPWAQ